MSIAKGNSESSNIYNPLELLNEIEILNNQLIKEVDERKKILLEYKELNSSYSNLLKKYNALRKSKLGKLTIKYWDIKKKVKHKQ